MRQVTYQEYLNNPAIREQLEIEARRARSAAIRNSTVALLRLFSWKPAAAARPQLKTA